MQLNSHEKQYKLFMFNNLEMLCVDTIFKMAAVVAECRFVVVANWFVWAK